MNYYTQTIPPTLAEKLKEKGMPDIEIVWNPIRGKHYCFKTYAEVFDWLIREGIYFHHYPTDAFMRKVGEWYFCVIHESIEYQHCSDWEFWKHTWHEAANAAIEKALELIKEK